MDMKKLLEAVTKFSGEEAGQKSSKELVGDSILKDLSKGSTPKTKEKELAEEWAAFSEENIGTHPKRPARKNARHARGHEPQPRYKTIKADEGAMSDKDIELQDYRSMSHKEFQTAYNMTKTEWINKNKSLVITNPGIKKGLGIDEGAEQDPIVAKVVKQMRPGLTGLNMGNEAFLYFAYELGKQRARDSWSDYLPAIRAEYEKGLNEDANTDNKLAKLLTRFINQNEGAGHAVASDAIEYIKKMGHIEQFATSLDYFGVDLDEGWESGPEEYEEPYDDADDAYDRQRQEKIDTEAEKEWAKLPKVSTYKLVGRGPNMEPNYEFGDEFDSMEQALEYRAEIMKDPKTPHPEHIGIRTLTRVVDKKQTDEAVEGGGGIKNIEDYTAKRDYIYQQLANPKQVDNYPHFRQALYDLMRLAREKGIKIEESRAHKQLATWFKNRKIAQKYASGDAKIPTPQERNDKIENPKAKKEKVDEYGATSDPVQKPVYAQSAGATGLPDVSKLNPQQKKDLAARVDPDAEKKASAAVASLKSATGSTASPDKLMKALDSADQGKSADAQTMSALQPVMDVVRKAGTNPKLSGTLKSLINQAKTV
jgi:hypothetical protein